MSLKTWTTDISQYKQATGYSRNLLVPEDLVESTDDEHDCGVLGARAARHRVLPREYPLLALIRLSCSTRRLLGTQLDPSI